VDAYHNAEAREQYQRNSIDALGDTIQLLDVILALVL
jgi:predicted transposase YdaD